MSRKKPKGAKLRALPKAPKPKGPFGSHFLLEWRRTTIDPATGKKIGQQKIERTLKEWRVEPASYSMVGRIERGEQPYSQEILEGLCKIYGIDPAVALSRAPNQSDGTTELLRLWAEFEQHNRRDAINTLQSLLNVIKGNEPNQSPTNPGRNPGKAQRA